MSDELKADPVSLYEIFSADNELRCPLFQRRFVWSRTNIKTLWEDLDTLLDGQFDVRFLGALVFHNETPASARSPGLYWIVDGQQRLTTFYLLLLSLVEVASESGMTSKRDELVSQYLLSRKKTSEDKPKLRSTLEDTRQFNAIIKSVIGERAKIDFSHEFGPSEGQLRDGYNIMLKETRSRCMGPDNNVDDELVTNVFECVLERVEFVEILLGAKHDPNEVFDRLNREGERLGIIDLVRNEVLKRLKDEPDNAENVYARHWRPFEDSFKFEKSRDQYFFPFALSHDSTVTKSKTFRSLSDRWGGMVDESVTPSSQVEKIMEDLSKHAPVFQALKEGSEIEQASEEMAVLLDRLYRLDCPTVTFPYFFNLLTRAVNDEVSEHSAERCCDVIESFLVRRAFVGLEPTGLHAVFKGLWGEAGSDPDRVKQCIQTKTIQFPDDSQFEEAVRFEPLFFRNKKRFIVQELESSIKKSGVFRTVPDFTLDHVLPQDPDGEWLELFTESDRERYTHVWANLVPLSPEENSMRGRSSWEETREKLRNETMFSTTKHLYEQYPRWTPESVERRSEELAEWAIRRWPK